MSETVTLTVNGKSVTVPKGTNVLEAARQAGIEISYFCYHPGLTSPAVCRQCLVDVKGQPKLVPSCYTPATEGMVVDTASEKARVAQQQMLEFTLVNHPIDCPICDKAGECTLQKLYFEWDHAPSRIDLDKVQKAKKVDVGPEIVLDQERCILCTRCIRVCDEVAGEHQLEMANRGDREILTTAPGKQLDNPYSLNTVDVCPVGALTAKDFRFTMRAWELFTTPSVCNGCATGCNVEIHHKENRVYRLVPRHNADVNKYWMCDEGRHSYKHVHEARAAAPGVDGLPSSWEKAVTAAAGKLREVLDRGRERVAVVLAAGHANEDNWVLGRLAREFLGVTKAFVHGLAPRPERADKILRDADVNPNSAGALAIATQLFGSPSGSIGDTAALEKALAGGELDAVIALGGDPISAAALEGARKLKALVVIAAHETGLAQAAHVTLPAADWVEVHATITNRQGKVQRLRAAFPPGGQALPAWEGAVKLGKKLGAVIEYAYPRAVFQEMVEKVPAFAGASWGKDAPLIQLRFAGSRG
jgi:NADH-quinone oxidoreductase subunit G